MADRAMTVLQTLMVDATLVEVVGAFRADGIDPILLKGPSTAQWLYPDDPWMRPYGDVDLLVAPADFQQARRVLTALGFEELLGADSLRANEASAHADSWVRSSTPSAAIDLHRVPPQVTVSPEAAWAALQPHRDPITISRTTVDALDVRGRAMIVAAHMTHHNGSMPKPREDLRRAIAAADDDVWRAAATLAATLGCASEVSGGLRAFPDGAALAERIGLAEPSWFSEAFAAGELPRQKMKGAISLAEATDLRTRVGILTSELFPSRQFMEYAHPKAKEGWSGLVLAYAGRPFELLRTSPAAYAQYRRARTALRAAARADAPLVARNGVVAKALRVTWTVRALLSTRRQLRSGPLEAVRVPPPVGVPPGLSGIARALRMTRASCLERSLVRQAWWSAQGVRRVVVIGVTAPGDGFRAHAWLEGDAEDVSDFTEITRQPPR